MLAIFIWEQLRLEGELQRRGLRLDRRRARNNLDAVFGERCEDAAVADQIEVGRGDHRCQARDEI